MCDVGDDELVIMHCHKISSYTAVQEAAKICEQGIKGNEKES